MVGRWISFWNHPFFGGHVKKKFWWVKPRIFYQICIYNSPPQSLVRLARNPQVLIPAHHPRMAPTKNAAWCWIIREIFKHGGKACCSWPYLPLTFGTGRKQTTSQANEKVMCPEIIIDRGFRSRVFEKKHSSPKVFLFGDPNGEKFRLPHEFGYTKSSFGCTNITHPHFGTSPSKSSGFASDFLFSTKKGSKTWEDRAPWLT